MKGYLECFSSLMVFDPISFNNGAKSCFFEIWYINHSDQKPLMITALISSPFALKLNNNSQIRLYVHYNIIVYKYCVHVHLNLTRTDIDANRCYWVA